ncbi:hypothetical protein AHAS_Ahas15G0145800 [Arachis hypogaea]
MNSSYLSGTECLRGCKYFEMNIIMAHQKNAEQFGRMADEMKRGLTLVEACMEIFVGLPQGAPSRERRGPTNVTVTGVDSIVMECTKTPCGCQIMWWRVAPMSHALRSHLLEVTMIPPFYQVSVACGMTIHHVRGHDISGSCKCTKDPSHKHSCLRVHSFSIEDNEGHETQSQLQQRTVWSLPLSFLEFALNPNISDVQIEALVSRDWLPAPNMLKYVYVQIKDSLKLDGEDHFYLMVVNIQRGKIWLLDSYPIDDTMIRRKYAPKVVVSIIGSIVFG